MRMRKMRNLEPRMAACDAYRIDDAAARRGLWRQLKPDCTALWVEVGCGKGKFTAETAAANPDVLLIAVERCREAVVVGDTMGVHISMVVLMVVVMMLSHDLPSFVSFLALYRKFLLSASPPGGYL